MNIFQKQGRMIAEKEEQKDDSESGMKNQNRRQKFQPEKQKNVRSLHSIKVTLPKFNCSNEQLINAKRRHRQEKNQY